MDSQTLTIEALRLLIYVAWADGEIAPEEYDYLLALARNHSLPEEEVAAMEASVRDPARVTKPDFEALKPFRDQILPMARKLIEADEHIDDAEVEMLHRIASLLS